MVTTKIWHYNSKLPSSLIMVRSLATLDELLSAMVLWHLLNENKSNPAIYLGSLQDSSLLAELISTNFSTNFFTDLTFYQAMPVERREVIHLKLDSKVKKLDWQQSPSQIQFLLDCETKPDLSDADFSLTKNNQEFFADIWLIGTSDFQTIEAWPKLDEVIDTAKSKIHSLTCQINDDLNSKTSISEQIIKLAKEKAWKISPKLTEILVSAKENALRFYSIAPENKLTNWQLASDKGLYYLKTQAAEYQSLLDFWSGKLATEEWPNYNNLDMKDLLLLILSFPELNKFDHTLVDSIRTQTYTWQVSSSNWSIIVCAKNSLLEKSFPKNFEIISTRTFPTFKLLVVYRK